MKIFITSCIVTCLCACSPQLEEQQLFGNYSPINYKNTFDTIQLRPLGVYHRKVFDKNNNMVLEMTGTWSLLRHNQIKFNQFYQNFDDDLIKFPESIGDTTMTLVTNLDASSRNIEFCIGYSQGENCYKKVGRNVPNAGATD